MTGNPTIPEIKLANVVPGVAPVDSSEKGVNETFVGLIQTSSEQVRAYIDVLDARQLMNELICSTLGRSVGLPVPEGFLVRATASDLPESDILAAPPYLSRQVKDAKAKLWDLAQVQEYLHAREFNLSPNLNRFELLIHRVRDDDPQYSDRQILQVQEAVYELEANADKKVIRCRPLRPADEIAGIIVEAEAA